MSLALDILSGFHDRIYLTTQTTSYKAVNIYLDFGFTPFSMNKQDAEGWKLLNDYLKHPQLAAFS